MNNISNEVKESNSNNIFSILSFGFALIATIIIIYFLFLSPATMKLKDLPQQMKLINIAIGSCIIGMTFSIISFIKKEKSNKFKLIGTILNGTMFIIFILTTIFRIVIDYKNNIQ